MAGHDFRWNPGRGRRAIQSGMMKLLDALESSRLVSKPDADVGRSSYRQPLRVNTHVSPNVGYS